MGFLINYASFLVTIVLYSLVLNISPTSSFIVPLPSKIAHRDQLQLDQKSPITRQVTRATLGSNHYVLYSSLSDDDRGDIDDDPVLAALLPLSNDKLKEELKERGIEAKGSKRKLAELLRDEILAEVDDDDDDDEEDQLPEKEFMEPLEGDEEDEEGDYEDSAYHDEDAPEGEEGEEDKKKPESEFQTSRRLLSSLPPSLKLYFKKNLKTNSLTPIQSQIFEHLFSEISQAPPFIIHSATGSGKTLGYLVPLLAFLGLWDSKSERLQKSRSRTNAPNALIVTPTSELAYQVSEVLKDLLAYIQTDASTNPVSRRKGRIDLKVAVITPPQNVHLLSTGSPSQTSDNGAGASNDATTSTIFIGSAKQVHGSLSRSTGGLSPTPPPLVDEFYKGVGFLVLDEVDRLLLNKKKKGKGMSRGGGKNSDLFEDGREREHEKPAAVLAANVAKYRMGRVVVVGASATVGRNVRREFCRVLGLKYMDPLVVRKASEQKDSEDGQEGGEEEGEGDMEETTTPEGRMVKIPDTVNHYFARFEGGGGGSGGGGGQLAGAAQVSQKLSDSENRRILLVLTKNCGLSVKDSVGALSFLNSKPKPCTLADARGDKSLSTFLAVTTEDMVRGLDLNVNTVIIVGKASGPDSYTHIAGRCGRAGEKGSVISVIGYEDSGRLVSWSNMLGIEFEGVEMDEITDDVR
ncbi:hypothetical protein TrST_g2699 [Triparma strigata]|uniref:ATP-dependent RNA helicase n=1 Tax=Triparma strigata TaxID=1606541 RepID=A0A9W7EWI9_9STRA|nr:hypothetical protein TrST_g2699 [Triparma strigata]